MWLWLLCCAVHSQNGRVDALLLKDLEGYSCHEIAEILHEDEKQVSVYLYRARVSMRKTLIALGYDNNN